MAKKVDTAAAKQRQQKIVLAVGAVILAGVLAFQGPKLMKQIDGSSSKSAKPAATSTSSPSTTSTAGGTAVPAVATGPGAAQLAGIVIRPAGMPTAGTGQLWSLSRFKSKDPFVQQVQQTVSGSGAPAVAGTTAGATGGKIPAGGIQIGPGGVVIGGGTVVGGTPAAPPTFATIMVNGKPQQLTLKQQFPKREPTFVLLAVGRRFVKIGVAGGRFTDGRAITIAIGKPVTLMNTATDRRFVMRLVYTGAQPEQIAGFTAPAKSPTRLTAGATP